MMILAIDGGTTNTRLTLLLPYSEGALAGEIRAKGKVFSEEFTGEGLLIDAMVELKALHRCRRYVIRG